MKTEKWPVSARTYICIGLLMITLPFTFKEYLNLPDFFRGFLAGVGLALEINGLVILKRRNRGRGFCQQSNF